MVMMLVLMVGMIFYLKASAFRHLIWALEPFTDLVLVRLGGGLGPGGGALGEAARQAAEEEESGGALHSEVRGSDCGVTVAAEL
jgi:hypothetical protein